MTQTSAPTQAIDACDAGLGDLSALLTDIARRNSGIDSAPLRREERQDEAAVRLRWKRWLRFGGGYDWRVLRRRMRAEGLRPSAVYLPRRVGALPAWCATLEALIRAAHALGKNADVLAEANARLPPGGEQLAFSQLLVPCLQIARERLTAYGVSQSANGDLLTQEAWPGLENMLLSRLGEVAGQALMEMFSGRRKTHPLLLSLLGNHAAASTTAPNAAYHAFVAEHLRDGYVALFQRWPVLARLLTVVIEHWAGAVAEFCQRLKADHVELRRRFFPEACDAVLVDAVDATLSDAHAGGRTVLQVRFSDGTRIIYKPRSMDMEAAFSDALAWLNEQPEQPYRQRIAQVWAREGYGWMEWIATAALKVGEESAYYWRLGSLIGLFRALNGADMHYENIVAAGALPVFVDVECLLHPSPRPFLEMPAIADKPLWMSPRAVLNLGIMPFYSFTRKQVIYNLGAIGAPPSGAGPEEPYFARPNCDWMSLEKREKPINSDHYPRRADGWCNALDHRHDLAAGFAATLHLVLRRRDWLIDSPASPLASLRQAQGRHLARNTWHYGLLLHGAVAPQALTDGIMFDLTFEPLHRHLSQFTPGFRAMSQVERADLRLLDVPRFGFGADHCQLLDAHSRPVAPMHNEPPYATLRRELLALSNEQVDWEARVLAAALRPEDYEGFTSAKSCAEDLWSRRLISPDQRPLWFSLANVSDGTTSHPLGPGLYNGLAGLALALTAAARANGQMAQAQAGVAELQQALASLPTAALDHVPFSGTLEQSFIAGLPGLGYDHGAAGLLFTMAHCARLANDSALAAHIPALANHWLGDDRIDALLRQDQQHDLLNGSAGLLLVLLQLVGNDTAHPLLARARRCGDNLLRKARPVGDGLVWAKPDMYGLSGLSHGGSGFAVALAALYRATGHGPYRDAAFAALRYEATLYNPQQRNWRDLRQFTGSDISTVQYHGISWCHGAPGIALAHAGLLSLLADNLTSCESEQLRETLHIALATTEAHLARNDSRQIDDLCCGSAGCIDILLECGRLLDRPELIAAAHGHAHTRRQYWAADQEQHPRFWFSQQRIAGSDLSLFKGISGWTYLQARLAAPDETPCVLLPLPTLTLCTP